MTKKISKKDNELLWKCIFKSKVAMNDSEKLVELGEIFAELSAHAHIYGKKKVLEHIYRFYFNNTLLNHRTFDLGTEKGIKIRRRNAMRGCSEIMKLNQLPYFKGLSKNHTDDINSTLNGIQSKLPALCESYFRFLMDGCGQTDENKNKDKRLSAEIKQLLDNDRIVATVNTLKSIGYSETKSFKVVSTLLEFSPPYRIVTPEAVRERYKNHA